MRRNLMDRLNDAMEEPRDVSPREICELARDAIGEIERLKELLKSNKIDPGQEFVFEINSDWKPTL